MASRGAIAREEDPPPPPSPPPSFSRQSKRQSQRRSSVGEVVVHPKHDAAESTLPPIERARVPTSVPQVVTSPVPAYRATLRTPSRSEGKPSKFVRDLSSSDDDDDKHGSHSVPTRRAHSIELRRDPVSRATVKALHFSHERRPMRSSPAQAQYAAVVSDTSEESFTESDSSSGVTPRSISAFTRAVAQAWLCRLRERKNRFPSASAKDRRRPMSSAPFHRRLHRTFVGGLPQSSAHGREWRPDDAYRLREENEHLSKTFAEQLEEIDALRHEREDRFRREKEQRLMIIRLRREKGERERKIRERQREIQRIREAVLASERAEALAEQELARLREDRSKRKILYAGLMREVTELRALEEDCLVKELPHIPRRPCSAASRDQQETTSLPAGRRSLQSHHGRAVVTRVLVARSAAVEAERSSITQLMREYPAAFGKRADFFITVSVRLNDLFDYSQRRAAHELEMKQLLAKRRELVAILEFERKPVSLQRPSADVFRRSLNLECRSNVLESELSVTRMKMKRVAFLLRVANAALLGAEKLNGAAAKAVKHVKRHVSALWRRSHQQVKPDDIRTVSQLEELIGEGRAIEGRELRQRATLIELRVQHESEEDLRPGDELVEPSDESFLRSLSKGMGPLTAPSFPPSLVENTAEETKQRDELAHLQAEIEQLSSMRSTCRINVVEGEEEAKRPATSQVVAEKIANLEKKVIPELCCAVEVLNSKKEQTDEGLIAALAKIEDICANTKRLADTIRNINIDEGEEDDD